MIGALWDSEAKCWYVQGKAPVGPWRWSETPRDEEFNITLNDAYVASAALTCPHCSEETQVICPHCISGIASEQELEQFTFFDITAVDDSLLEELKRWPSFRRSSQIRTVVPPR
jgi:hypothetical protein